VVNAIEAQHSAQTAPAQLELTLACVDRRSAHGIAPVVDGDVSSAVRAAYRSAELALSLQDQALLRVHTTPEGRS